MASFYDQTMSPMTYPPGSRDIEARLVRLETHCWHENRARLESERQISADIEWLADSIKAVREEIEEVKRDRAALIMKIGAWIITSLLGVVGLIVWEGLRPAIQSLGSG
jgi:hypothetical protein